MGQKIQKFMENSKVVVFHLILRRCSGKLSNIKNTFLESLYAVPTRFEISIAIASMVVEI